MSRLQSVPSSPRHAPPRESHVTVVTVPGLHGSEPAHWQSWLEGEFAGARRVEQHDWEAPHLDTWAQAIHDVLTEIDGPAVLAAHSFGCLATAHLLTRAQRPGVNPAAAKVRGVLFVAPASPVKFRHAGDFGARRLDAPSLVVGSETDPWMPLDDARTLAQRWNSAFVNLGDAGHINTAAGFGPWPLARHIVETLARRASEEQEVFEERRAYG